MKIAVAGGTGTAGRYAVVAGAAAGQDTVVVSLVATPGRESPGKLRVNRCRDDTRGRSG